MEYLRAARGLGDHCATYDGVRFERTKDDMGTKCNKGNASQIQTVANAEFGATHAVQVPSAVDLFASGKAKVLQDIMNKMDSAMLSIDED